MAWLILVFAAWAERPAWEEACIWGPNDDVNEDGFKDACVHPSATLLTGVDVSRRATVGQGAVVGDQVRVRERIGDYATVGDDAFVLGLLEDASAEA